MEVGLTAEALESSDMNSSNKRSTQKVFRCVRRRKIMADKNSFSESASRSISYEVSKFDLTDLEWTTKISECPVYHPSEQEFEDPLAYIQKIAPEAYKYGICKIASPINASIPAAVVLMKEIKGFKFETNVQPLRLSEWNENDKLTFLMRGRKYTYREFETLANKAFRSRFRCSGGLPSPYVEKEFWRVMAHKEKAAVEYGVNVEGSAFSCDPDDKLGKSKWNLKSFSWLAGSTLRLIEKEIPGITNPMLYIGMIFSMFAWHVEDHYLYSINYHHSGANKTWYGVPGHAATQFENVVMKHVYCDKILSQNGNDGAFQILAHKTTMFPPSILQQHDVPIYKAVQKPGEFVITFPRAYHAGFSHGFNCGEAVNFAISDWFPFGASATRRYARLRMLPIIPYEELLCKEAMLVYKSSKGRGSKNKPKDLASSPATVLSFVHLMQSYKEALLRLNCSLALSISSTSLGTVICSHCHRDCYVAYKMCKYCYSYPICLFHDNGVQTCPCGALYTIYKRNDMSELEDAASSFEQGKDIQLEDPDEMNCGVNTFSLSSIFSNVRDECFQDIMQSVMKDCRKRGPPTVMAKKKARMRCKLRKNELKLTTPAPTISF